MPAALVWSNASPQQPISQDGSRKMDQAMNQGKPDPALCPTDDEAVAPQGPLPLPPSHKQSLDYVWRTGLAGGLAGCAAKSVVAPLDRVKILFQASNPQFARYTGSWFGVVAAMKEIYKGEGAVGLYRGHSATILRIFPYAAIKFIAYEQIRALVIRHPEQETPLRRLVSGSAAGVTSVFFTYPLEVVRVRLAFETKKDSRSSFSAIVKHIYNERPAPLPSALKATASQPLAAGVQSIAMKTTSAVQAVTPRARFANFYRGFSATMMGMLPYAGISFLTHDTAGDILRHPAIAQWTTLDRPANAPAGKPAPLRSWAELLSGGVAGLVSQTASYPLEVIRRRMQVGGAVGDGHRLGISETARLIFRERGLMGYWVGLSIGYVKIVPMAAVSFYVYERGKTFLGV
ncbi:MAG: hypothetical protein M1818_008327 [Claussenomyces sp. TS43310]|nr:MAG: hypothetical protein M1818_008327 [Claussenomyces sp. TS43310]